MHVLILPSWYSTRQAPAAGVYFARQARAAAEAGVRVGVVYPERQSLRHVSPRGLVQHRFQTRWYHEDGLPTLRQHGWNLWWRLPARFDAHIRAAVRLADRYVRRCGKPDLIHAHSARWAAVAARRIAATYELPYVVTEHFSGFERGLIGNHQQRLVREGFDGASSIATVSSALREMLVDQGWAVREGVDVIPNFVDETFFTRPVRRPAPPPFRLLDVTSLEPWKGVDVLIRAFERAFGQREDVVLDVAGGGSRRRPLERLARELGVHDRITFLGALHPDQVREAMWAAHAFVHPSDHETFGIVLIEALATGLPVLATSSGGPEDIVTPQSGSLVPPRDVPALAEAMRDLVDYAHRYDVEAIRRDAVERFGAEMFRSRIVSWYNNVASTAP